MPQLILGMMLKRKEEYKINGLELNSKSQHIMKMNYWSCSKQGYLFMHIMYISMQRIILNKSPRRQEGIAHFWILIHKLEQICWLIWWQLKFWKRLETYQEREMSVFNSMLKSMEERVTFDEINIYFLLKKERRLF
jgi:hypothetical protein